MFMIKEIVVVGLVIYLVQSCTSYVPRESVGITSLDTSGDLKLEWKINYDEKLVKFKIDLSEKVTPFNWFLVGFSDRGTFTNADLCLLWVDFKGHVRFEDTHTDDTGKLRIDSHFDCDEFYLNERKREIGFQRKFNTCDPKDYIIEEGTTHIVWAYGPDTLFSANGLDPSRAKSKGFTRARLFLPPPVKRPQKSITLKVTNNRLKVPSSDTTYWCKIIRLPKFLREKAHHIIQYESTITKGNKGLVHHMEVFYCDADSRVQMPTYEGSCFSPDRPNITQACSKVKAAWAMGAPPFVYPEETGLLLGGPEKNQFIMLEVHYNNPEMNADKIDSSGITFHFSPKLRKFNAGIMELGLEYTDKMSIPPKQSSFTLEGYCVPECTSVGLPLEGILVFGSQLHTHLTGIRVRTFHFRDGHQLPNLNEDEHYSTHFQEIRLLRKPVLVLPDDYLLTSCDYNTMERDSPTIGGHAITDEMCVNYLHYYPAVDLEVCKSSISTKHLNNYFKYENRWDGMELHRENASPRDQYNAIKPWNNIRVQALKWLYDNSPISMQCNRSDSTRFQGDWEEINIPEIRPARVQEGNCGPLL